MAKRLFDVVVAAILLLVLFPVFVVAGVLTRLDSRGPVLFRQSRVGRHFEPFVILKFRTMEVGTSGPSITVRDDPRVTRVGRILRLSKLDELPQLINVLKGEMSLVGPRPELKEYVEMFQDDFTTILSVRPGLTDLASVAFLDEESVLAAADDYERAYTEQVLPRKIELAKEYARRQSLWLDITILFRTLSSIGRQVIRVDR